jgi:hypothetical protein
MYNLIEHVLNEDYVSAQNVFESRLDSILEKKLYEKKRMMQAEIFGALSKADIEARRKAGYVKASEVLPDPRDVHIGIDTTQSPKKKEKILKRKKLKENTPIPASAITAIAARATDNKGKRKRKASPEPEKRPEVDKSADEKRPGIITRNLNTLMGHEPGYKKPKTPPEQEGGRLGKAVRGAAGLVSRFGSEVGWVEE